MSHEGGPGVSWMVTFSMIPKGGGAHPLHRDLMSLLQTPFSSEWTDTIEDDLRKYHKPWRFYNRASRSTYGFFLYRLKKTTGITRRIDRHIRNGINDYRYAQTLDRLIQEKHLTELHPAQRLLRQVLSPEAEPRSIQSLSTLKIKVGEEIEGLLKVTSL